jgi:hypothetical protein
MIPKSGYRFSDEIVFEKEINERVWSAKPS